MSEAAIVPRLQESAWATCDCGKRMLRGKLLRHRAKCMGPSHCAHCRPASVRDVTDRLRQGMVVDAVAAELGRSLDEVYRVRKQARAKGCLPMPTGEEKEAAREALSLARHGKRQCSECEGEFVPRLQTPDQATCGPACFDVRKKRMKREERAAKPGYKPYEEAGDPTAEQMEAQMRPLKQQDEWMLAEYTRTGAMIEANREKFYALWGELLGVAL